MAVFETESLAQALAAARQLQEAGFDLFRGQLYAWPVRPSLWRLAPHERPKAQLRLQRFADWVQQSPQVADALDSEDAMTAVAQHHGLATAFLDVTTAPEIAAFFAQDGAQEGVGRIMAWRSADLETVEGLRLVRLDVSNLWRLEAQQGAFLAAESEAALEALTEAAIISFPHASDLPVDLPVRERIYPERASQLEVMLTEFFNLLRQSENADLAAESGVVETLNIADWAPRRCAFFGHTPPVGEGWASRMLSGEGLSQMEREAFATTQEKPIKAPGKSAWQSARGYHIALRNWLLKRAPSFLGKSAPRPNWSLSCLKDGAVRKRFEAALNDLSDRLRFLDLSPEDWADAHALALAVTRLGAGDEQKSEAVAEALLGAVQDVELRSLSGSKHYGQVSLAGLAAALSPQVGEALLPYYTRKAAADPMLRLEVGVHPAHIFRFDGFQRLLACEIAPLMAIKEACYVPSEDEPERKGYAGLSSLNAMNVSAITRRGDFVKPIHLFDPHMRDAMYLYGDMSEAEAFAQGQAAVAHMLAGGGQSKFVRLMDYADKDDLPVWNADPMSQVHAQALVEAGALIAMQPATTMMIGESMPNTREDAFGQKGWGGLEIVALAMGACDGLFGGDGETLQAVYNAWRNQYLQELETFSAETEEA